MERIHFLRTVKRLPVVIAIAVSPIFVSCEERQPMCVGNISEGQFRSNLVDAVSSLNYTPGGLKDFYGVPWNGNGFSVYHAAQYPNGHKARSYIDSVESHTGSLPEISSRLYNVHESIPDDEEIKQVNGKDVDYVTFTSQTRELTTVIDDGSKSTHPCSISEIK